jgi:hypothetical protein
VKEIIYLESGGAGDYIHCCRYEHDFDYLDNKDCDNQNVSTLFDETPQRCGDHFMITVFTNHQFPLGQRVKLTLETIDDGET